MRGTFRLGFVGVVVATAMVVMSAGASAVDDIVITISGIATGAPGDVLLIEEVTVAPELVGATCTGRAQAENQSSVHPNNDVLITTGSSQAVLADIEGAPGKVTPISGSVVLGSAVRLELRLGPDGISSGGVTVTFDCVAVPPTTTAPPTTTVTPTTAAPPATTAALTTAAPATAAPVATSVAAASALPKTGSSSGLATLAVATVLLVAGVAMVRVRPRAEP